MNRYSIVRLQGIVQVLPVIVVTLNQIHVNRQVAMMNSDNDPQDIADQDIADQDLADTERQSDLATKGTPLDAKETVPTKFRQEIASKQAGLDNHEPEENLWSGGFSPRAMLGFWILMGAISIALLIAAFGFSAFQVAYALGAVVLIWILGALLYVWRRLRFHYQLTTQRFIHQTGILTRTTDRIEVIDIDDVSYTQGPFQRALGVGSIVLTGSNQTDPKLSMIGISNVKEVAGLIDDMRRKERRKRSLHIEAI